METGTVKLLVGYLRQARKFKADLVNIAKENPTDFLQTYRSLDPKEQKYLEWLRDIAQRQIQA